MPELLFVYLQISTSVYIFYTCFIYITFGDRILCSLYCVSDVRHLLYHDLSKPTNNSEGALSMSINKFCSSYKRTLNDGVSLDKITPTASHGRNSLGSHASLTSLWPVNFSLDIAQSRYNHQLISIALCVQFRKNILWDSSNLWIITIILNSWSLPMCSEIFIKTMCTD